jgi:hypothetical protein
MTTIQLKLRDAAIARFNEAILHILLTNVGDQATSNAHVIHATTKAREGMAALTELELAALVSNSELKVPNLAVASLPNVP